MSDRMRHVPGTALSRRRMLAACAGAVALPAVLGACGTGTDGEDDETVLLAAMADQARTDAALAVAAVTADPGLTGRLEPLRAARMAHATALDAAAGRLSPQTPATSGTENIDLAKVRDSVAAAARSAAQVVGGASVGRVGLVAEVAACCATYTTVLA